MASRAPMFVGGAAVVVFVAMAVGYLARKPESGGPPPAATPTIAPTYPEFPWPPPKASASWTIPNNLLRDVEDKQISLGEVDTKLSKVLDSCGYVEKSYYSVPDGFAVVTRLERIHSDGTPTENRWDLEVTPLKNFSLKAYLKALFIGNKGNFRIIVFIITPHAFTQTGAETSFEDVSKWIHDGLNRLPVEFKSRVYAVEYSCTALIYEFEKPSKEEEAYLKQPSLLTAEQHLAKARILPELKGAS